MEDSPVENRPPHRAIHLWLLAFVCLGAFLLRSQGIDWPKFHPDEYPIGIWIENTADHAYVSDKVYAGGFFTLARPVQWCCRVARHAVQAWAYHRGATDCVQDDHFDAMLFARWFNVWLGTLTCLFLYGLVRRVTGSGGAGVLAAALLAFAQYPVEHCHYGETDIAMVFMLTLALWAWSTAIDNRRLFWFIAAALVSGFAAGTKFPLMILAVLVLGMGLIRTGLPPRLTGLAYAGLGVGLFALGFILANPMTVMDWDGFRAGLTWEHRRVYAEMALNLGVMNNDPHFRFLAHLWAMSRGLATLGWGWIILAIIGIPCALLKDYRRFWPVLLLFPALYSMYWIFTAPWVRTQEFMNYLPVLAALAMLPLVILWRARRPLFRLTVLIMACTALTLNAWNGLQVAALFGWTDTRLMARQWLERHLPASATLAVESYAEPACPDTRQPQVLIDKIEKDEISRLQAHGADYVLRAANVTGRGLVHPITDRRYPSVQRKFDEFIANSQHLRAWCPLTRHNLATFISPTIELWGLAEFIPKHILALELPQPLLVSDVYENVYGNDIQRPTFFDVGHKLGSATGLLIDRRTRTFAIGGPGSIPQPMYLILNTDARGATVHIRGYGRKWKVDLAPYALAILPLKRSWRHISGMPFERITIAAAPREDMMYIPCYARVAFSAAEVARISSELGHVEAFWSSCTDGDLAQMPDPIQKYMLAVQAGRWDLADRWEPMAIQAGAKLNPLLGANPDDVQINGNNGYYYNAFARVRLQKYGLSMISHDELFKDRLLITGLPGLITVALLKNNVSTPPVYEGELTLPVRTARGRYELAGDLLVKPEPTPGSTVATTVIEYSMNHGETWMGTYSPEPPAGWMQLNVGLSAGIEIQPRIMIRSTTPARLYFRNMELRWSLKSALESTCQSFGIACAAHALHGGRYAGTLDILDKLDATKGQPGALEIRQLRFQALLAVVQRDSSRLTAAARDVLALAPDDYRCLVVLAENDPVLQAKVDLLAGNLQEPVACGPFLSLVGCAFDPRQHQLTGVFEVLKNETPPLAAVLYIRRHGAWRERQIEPLTDRPWLYRGERVALNIRLSETFGTPVDIQRLGLGIQTDVQWHPGRIPIAGRHDNVIPLSDIAP